MRSRNDAAERPVPLICDATRLTRTDAVAVEERDRRFIATFDSEDHVLGCSVPGLLSGKFPSNQKPSNSATILNPALIQ